MKHFSTLVLVGLIQFSSYSQIKSTPLLGVKAYCHELNRGLMITGFTISPGLEINQRFNAGINFSRFQSTGHANVNSASTSDVLRGWVSSGFVGYHFTRPVTRFSPLLEFELGGIFRDAPQKVSETTSGLYYPDNLDKYRFFSKTKLLLDIQFKSLSIRFGTTFNLFEVRAFESDAQRYESNLLAGVGVEAGMTFLLGERKLNLSERSGSGINASYR